MHQTHILKHKHKNKQEAIGRIPVFDISCKHNVNMAENIRMTLGVVYFECSTNSCVMYNVHKTHHNNCCLI